MTDESDKERVISAHHEAPTPQTPVIGSLSIPTKTGGRLRYGSLPGQNAGAGRPKDKIRKMLRDWVWEKWSETPELALRFAELEPDEKLRALDMALRYGVGTQTETVSADEMRDQAKRMLDVLVDELVTRGWSLADVQALATKMAVAASNDEPEG